MTVFALVLIAVNAALWALFFVLYAKKASPRSALEAVRGEVNALLSEIRRETDTSATIIESRIESLKALIAEADARTLLAAKAGEARLKERSVLDALSAASPPPPPEDAAPLALFLAEDDAAPPPAPPRLEPETPPAPPIPRVTSAPEQIAPRSGPRAEALELARQGFPADFIAKKLRLSIGEVELIQNLYA